MENDTQMLVETHGRASLRVPITGKIKLAGILMFICLFSFTACTQYKPCPATNSQGWQLVDPKQEVKNLKDCVYKEPKPADDIVPVTQENLAVGLNGYVSGLFKYEGRLYD